MWGIKKGNYRIVLHLDLSELKHYSYLLYLEKQIVTKSELLQLLQPDQQRVLSVRL